MSSSGVRMNVSSSADTPEVLDLLAALVAEDYKPVRLAMQSQIFFTGVQLGGVNRRARNAYILGSACDPQLRRELESLGFEERRQYVGTTKERYWYQTDVKRLTEILRAFAAARSAVARRTSVS